MTESLSSIVKAGRLIRLLGWFQLVVTMAIGTAIVLPFMVKSEPIQLGMWLTLGAAILVSIAVLAIGAGVKQNKPWAKVLGGIVSLLSLLNIPIGTLMGGITLFYLVKGWREGPKPVAIT